MRKLKIYVADDHKLFRQAISRLLGEFTRVGEIKEVSNGKELMDLIRADIPDVVILDLDMPVLDGTKTCEKIAIEFPEVKIIIVSMHESKIQIYHLLQTGAHAFLSKNAESEELESAIYSIVDKGSYRNKMMREALRYQMVSTKELMKNITKVGLSEREYSIVKLLCNEFSNKEISKELSLSENTIRNHKVRIMRKTGVKNTPGLVKYAFQNGLIKNQELVV